MKLIDIYCLVCNDVDGQIEVDDDDRDTFLIVHKDCARGHEAWLKKDVDDGRRGKETYDKLRPHK